MSQIKNIAALFLLFFLCGCTFIAPRTGHAEITLETQAVGGINTRDLEAIVINRLNKPEPIDYAIVMIGTNDSLNTWNDVPVAEYERNLKRILQKLIDQGTVTFVAEILPCIDSYVLDRHPSLRATPNELVAEYNEALHRAASATTPPTPVIPAHSIFLPHTDLTADSWIRNAANCGATDGVHPTADGNRRIAQAYCDALVFKRNVKANVVLFGNSITASVHHQPPERVGDFLYALLNPTAARDWALYE